MESVEQSCGFPKDRFRRQHKSITVLCLVLDLDAECPANNGRERES
jgi:hypothetical protein